MSAIKFPVRKNDFYAINDAGEMTLHVYYTPPRTDVELEAARNEVFDALNEHAALVELEGVILAMREDQTSRDMVQAGETDIKSEAAQLDAARFYNTQVHKAASRIDEIFERLAQIRKAGGK